MVRVINIDDTRWSETLPHPVLPRPDDGEWLLGVLLRCDEDNNWPVGTTGYYVVKKRPASSGHLNNTGAYIVATCIALDRLAKCVGTELEQIERTTFLPELRGLYGIKSPTAGLLGKIPPFRICPLCIEKRRMLDRRLALPHINVCLHPDHGILLIDKCQCGSPLQPYCKGTVPFACTHCKHPWEQLPMVAAKDDVLATNRHITAWYDTFFAQGMGSPLIEALWGMRVECGANKQKTICTIDHVVPALSKVFTVQYRPDRYSLAALVTNLQPIRKVGEHGAVCDR